MIYQLLLTVAIIAGLMIGYYLVQRALRRVWPEIGDDRDVLETRWGCGHCSFQNPQDCPFHSKCQSQSESERLAGLLSG